MQLWRHPNGIFYVLRGPRLKHRASTRTRDRQAAEIFLSQFIAAHAVAAPDNPTVGFLLRGYEADALTRVRSVVSLKSCIKALLPYFDNLLPEHLTPPVIREYTVQRGRGVTAGSILRDLGVLRAALKWGLASRYVAAIPHIPNIVKQPPARNRWLTREEAKCLIAACVEPHIKTFVYLALMTGARSSAILEAKWKQVDWARKVISFGLGHGNKRRGVVPLNPELERVLVAAKELACSDFIVEWRGEQVFTIRNGFSRSCGRAGLGKDVTPHILRHTAATWMVIDGVPLREIARTLGDTEAIVEARYGKHHPDYLRRATNALQLDPELP